MDAWYGRAPTSAGGLFSRRFVIFLAIASALAAAAPMAVMWGFTVDDALISIRYAHHVATGEGYRFNPGGPSTDGVTPLPWVFVLAPLARGDALDVFARAKGLGAFAWLSAAVALGVHLGSRARNVAAVVVAAVGLGILGLAFPVGAWAASGMETGLATALATLAAIGVARAADATEARRALFVGAALAGVAASLRPELVVWSLALAAGGAVVATSPPTARNDDDPDASPTRGRGRGSARTRTKAIVAAAVLAVAPFGACAIVRLAVFGRPSPLAVLAKPSDASHGLVYAGAAVVVTLLPILALAPLALARAARIARVLALAAALHVGVVVAVGGDWMPYARLLVPILPSLVLVWSAWASPLAERPSRGVVLSAIVRAVVAVSLGAFFASRAAGAGRGVGADRVELVERARPLLASSSVVAGLDVGWIGAAAPRATIVDLAGLTDETIAILPGGHTSKRVDTAMLLERRVDTVVVYGEVRAVEARILRSDLFAARFVRSETIPFGARGASYTVYRLRSPE